MDRQDAIEKIKKCLALSLSSNEHEAATALRQAKRMMERFGVSDEEVAPSEVSEAMTLASVKRNPAVWESMLSGLVVGFILLWLLRRLQSHFI